MSSATRRASSLLAPVRSVYRTSGARGVAGMAKKPAMIGGGLFAGSGVVVKRRRSGLDRTTGRPTGMYNY